jgi:tetratricopeptide (TPR) repeat protein
MKNRSFFLIATSVFISYQSFGQTSQIKIAQNAVGKLQVAIASGMDKSKQMTVVGEGLKATESAQTDKKTKNWPETWAIRSYLSSYVALIDQDETNSEKYYATAVETLDSAKRLDKFQSNTALTDAANYNIILKKQEKGNKAYTNNEFKTAFTLLKEVSDFFPKDTVISINTALSAQNINDYNSALFYFKRAKDNGIKNPVVFQSMAGIYTSKFEQEAAIRILEDGLKVNPYNIYLNNNYINLLLDNERYDQAKQVIEKSLTIESKNKLLYFLYGYLYQISSNNSTAELAYKKALALDQNYFDALYQLGLVYVNNANDALKGDKEKRAQEFSALINRAEFVLLQAHEINPNDRPTVQLLIDIYTRKNRLDKAQELKRKLEEF